MENHKDVVDESADVSAEQVAHEALQVQHQLPQSAKGYSNWILEIYDFLILRLSSALVWRCPPAQFLALYKHFLSHRHLELGVGTGYLLEHAKFPTFHPRLTLLDANRRVLAHARRRLSRYQPHCIVQDMLSPNWPVMLRYRSIGMNYVWHALHADDNQRVALLKRLASYLDEEGVLFGATVVGVSDQMPKLAQLVSQHWIKVGVFNNQGHQVKQIQSLFLQIFDDVKVWQEGSVVFFVATQPKRD